jgi:quinolinate synthase
MTTAAVLYESLKSKLADTMPDAELRLKAEVAAEVLALKAERGAVILAHNYMEPALYHSVPDHRGDSLELSRWAARCSARVLVFCGVRFMAETAKILNPAKRVLLPTARGGCSLAASITVADVCTLRARFPDAPVVAYVNTSAEVKAEVDVCCTSSNAAEIIGSLSDPVVIFLPDEFLARNVARETRRAVAVLERDGTCRDLEFSGVGSRDERWLLAWHGRCEVHEKFTLDDIERVRSQFPDAVVLAHPECRPEVVEAADFSGSTAAMARFVSTCAARRYLLLTECTMGDNVAAASPGKEMLRLCSVRCPHMNEVRLEDVRDALRLDRYEVEVPASAAPRAGAALERMLRAP